MRKRFRSGTHNLLHFLFFKFNFLVIRLLLAFLQKTTSVADLLINFTTEWSNGYQHNYFIIFYDSISNAHVIKLHKYHKFISNKIFTDPISVFWSPFILLCIICIMSVIVLIYPINSTEQYRTSHNTQDKCANFLPLELASTKKFFSET